MSAYYPTTRRRFGRLANGGIEVIERIACEAPLNPYALPYLKTKKEKMGHSLTVMLTDCPVVVWKEMLGMAKPILVVTSRYTREIEDRIDRDYNARRNPNQFPSSHQKLLSAAEGADALFITPADRLDAGFFQQVSPTVKIIVTYSVGFEHIDLEAAARRKILVAYTPGVNHEATADIAMLLLLGASRRAYEAQELVRTGDWKALSPDMLLGWQVGGKVLGILGMGHVGQAVARRARGFGMKIHYYDTSELPPEIAGDAVYHEHPSDLLGVSRFLSLHAPETPQTHHFLNSKAISLLPHGGHRGEHRSWRIGGRRRPHRCSQDRAGRRCGTRRI